MESAQEKINNNERANIFVYSFIGVSIFGLILVFLFKTETSNLESPAMENDAVSEGGGLESVYGAPQIVNVMPDVAYVDIPYDFGIKVADSDTETKNLTVKIVEGPSWLELQSGNQLVGTPTITDVGLQSVTLEVSDGTHRVRKSFFVSVEESLL